MDLNNALHPAQLAAPPQHYLPPMPATNPHFPMAFPYPFMLPGDLERAPFAAVGVQMPTFPVPSAQTGRIAVIERKEPTQPRKRRKQVAYACVNCAAGHLSCSETLPCERCVKKGLDCVQRPRKKLKLSNDSTPSSEPLAIGPIQADVEGARVESLEDSHSAEEAANTLSGDAQFLTTAFDQITSASAELPPNKGVESNEAAPKKFAEKPVAIRESTTKVITSDVRNHLNGQQHLSVNSARNSYSIHTSTTLNSSREDDSKRHLRDQEELLAEQSLRHLMQQQQQQFQQFQQYSYQVPQGFIPPFSQQSQPQPMAFPPGQMGLYYHPMAPQVMNQFDPYQFQYTYASPAFFHQPMQPQPRPLETPLQEKAEELDESHPQSNVSPDAQFTIDPAKATTTTTPPPPPPPTPPSTEDS